MLEECVSPSGDQTTPLICPAPPPELTQSRRDDSTNPNRTRQHAADPSAETGGPERVFDSEHLSDALSSFSLTSLFTRDSLASPLAKKCYSTGSLTHVRSKDSRRVYRADQQNVDFWTEASGEERETRSAAAVKTCAQSVDVSYRHNR